MGMSWFISRNDGWSLYVEETTVVIAVDQSMNAPILTLNVLNWFVEIWICIIDVYIKYSDIWWPTHLCFYSPEHDTSNPISAHLCCLISPLVVQNIMNYTFFRGPGVQAFSHKSPLQKINLDSYNI